MWSFAQLSDPHLSPLPPAGIRALANKRAFGVLSWKLRRRAIHRADVLAALLHDLHAQAPGHIVVTGDITNVSLPAEFERGAAWLETVGTPRDVSVIPGNHDAYVPVAWDASLGLWARYMSSEQPAERIPRSFADFPFVRIRGPFAFVGVSTARPMAVLLATGAVGDSQLGRVEQALRSLDGRGLVRVLMLHHPPHEGATRARKRLLDAAGLRAVVARAGAELVIHGHTHRPSRGSLSSPLGPTPVIGTPSASASRAAGEHHYARYHIYRSAGGERPSISLEVRGLDAERLCFVSESVRELGVPTSEGRK